MRLDEIKRDDGGGLDELRTWGPPILKALARSIEIQSDGTAGEIYEHILSLAYLVEETADAIEGCLDRFMDEMKGEGEKHD